MFVSRDYIPPQSAQQSLDQASAPGDRRPAVASFFKFLLDSGRLFPEETAQFAGQWGRRHHEWEPNP
jgi:hypothetical protein